jgi:hypothetical protein
MPSRSCDARRGEFDPDVVAAFVEVVGAEPLADAA